MRWRDLFDDLLGQADALARLERDTEVADRTRSEVGQQTLINRLRGQQAGTLRLSVLGGRAFAGVLERVGADWLLLGGERETVVRVAAITSIADLPRAALAPDAVSPVARRLTLSSALRALAVDRARVTVLMVDGSTVSGTPSRVGRDFVDLALHPTDVAPRAAAVTGWVTLAQAAISAVIRDVRSWS